MSHESHLKHEERERHEHHHHPQGKAKGGLGIHPAWFAVLGVVLTLLAVLVWSMI